MQIPIWRALELGPYSPGFSIPFCGEGRGRAEYGYSLELQNRSYLLIPYLQLCQKNMRRHTSQLTEYPLIRIRKKKSVILKWQHCCVNFIPICNSDEPIVSNHPKRNDLTWGITSEKRSRHAYFLAESLLNAISKLHMGQLAPIPNKVCDWLGKH